MDWVNPYILLTFFPAVLLLWWFHHRSLRPMSLVRRRLLFAVRCSLVAGALLALAGPAWQRATDR